MRIIQWLPASILLLAVCGCGKTTTATGKVTYKDRPVTYGSVTFLNADKTARSGAIQSDGSYKVENLAPGEVKIGVISRDPSKGRSVTRGKKSAQSDAKESGAKTPAVEAKSLLPRKYENPDSSGLTCTIGSGRIRHDIELK